MPRLWVPSFLSIRNLADGPATESEAAGQLRLSELAVLSKFYGSPSWKEMENGGPAAKRDECLAGRKPVDVIGVVADTCAFIVASQGEGGLKTASPTSS
jgi:hypothetical protein